MKGLANLASIWIISILRPWSSQYNSFALVLLLFFSERSWGETNVNLTQPHLLKGFGSPDPPSVRSLEIVLIYERLGQTGSSQFHKEKENKWFYISKRTQGSQYLEIVQKKKMLPTLGVDKKIKFEKYWECWTFKSKSMHAAAFENGYFLDDTDFSPSFLLWELEF